MGKLLLDDKPLIVLPSLAEKIGLNESIILQQLHYWLLESKNIRDDFKWVYNTYEDWKLQFPFWSVSTIRRTISKLEKDGLIIVGNYNKLKIDNTKWYRVNYQLLDMSRPSVQNEQTECSKWTDDVFKMNRPLPESTTEITTKKDNTHLHNQFETFWLEYPRKVDKKRAGKSFLAAIKKHSFEQILNGTKAYAIQCKRENTEQKFIKHASTYLNNECYLEFSETPKPPEPNKPLNSMSIG